MTNGWEAHALLSLREHWNPPYTCMTFANDVDSVWVAVCASGDVLTAPDAVLLRLRIRDHYEAHQSELRKYTTPDVLPDELRIVRNPEPSPIHFPRSFVRELIDTMRQRKPEPA